MYLASPICLVCIDKTIWWKYRKYTYHGTWTMCIAHELDNGVLLQTQSDILQTTCVYCTYILYYLDMWLYRAQLLLQHWNSLVMIICSSKRVNILYKENHQTGIAFFSSHTTVGVCLDLIVLSETDNMQLCKLNLRCMGVVVHGIHQRFPKRTPTDSCANKAAGRS